MILYKDEGLSVEYSASTAVYTTIGFNESVGKIFKSIFAPPNLQRKFRSLSLLSTIWFR